jgi:hypothetical protein
LQEEENTKQESPSSFQERRTDMLQIEILSSTEALGKSELSKKEPAYSRNEERLP